MISATDIKAASVTGSINPSATIEGFVSTSPISLFADVDLGRLEVIHTSLPDYEGEYEIAPGVSAKTLDTANKSLREDIVIDAIPYEEEINSSGGITVLIAN